MNSGVLRLGGMTGFLELVVKPGDFLEGEAKFSFRLLPTLTAAIGRRLSARRHGDGQDAATFTGGCYIINIWDFQICDELPSDPSFRSPVRFSRTAVMMRCLTWMFYVKDFIQFRSDRTDTEIRMKASYYVSLLEHLNEEVPLNSEEYHLLCAWRAVKDIFRRTNSIISYDNTQ